MVRIHGLKIAVVLALALFAVSCKSGGDPQQDVRIVSINLNPAVAVAGGVIELTASISAPGQSIADLMKNWTVSTGTITTTPPEFGLLTRATAQSTDSSVSTTRSSVYWTAPQTTGQATITLEVGNDSESTTVTVGNSPLTLTVSTDNDGNKVCTVRANGVSDLYFAAFRVNHSGNWTPAGVEQGDFLGNSGETVFLGLTNQAGFVPVAISKTGTAAGEDGSGVLARVTFTPKAGTSSTGDPVADQAFALAGTCLVSSGGSEL